MLSQIPFQLPANHPDGLLFWQAIPAVAVVLAVLEFAFLYRILTRGDFDAPNKILWVLVVLGAPALGVLLYLLAAPSVAPAPALPRSQRARPGDDLSGTP